MGGISTLPSFYKFLPRRRGVKRLRDDLEAPSSALTPPCAPTASPPHGEIPRFASPTPPGPRFSPRESPAFLKLLGCVHPPHTHIDTHVPEPASRSPSPRKIKLGGKSVPPEFLEDRQPDDSQTDRWVTGEERGRPESLLLLLFFEESTEKMPLVAELRR